MSSPAYPTLSGGPCSPWCSPADVHAANPAIPEDADGLAISCEMAGDILWVLSARQFSGDCLGYARPCRVGCNCWGPESLGPGYLALGAFSWLGGSGYWWNDECSRSCGCGRLSEVALAGYPVTGIVAVTIDGVVLDPSEYRLDRNRVLVRLAAPDGSPQFWPACQNLDRPDGDANTWSVQYAYGAQPPAAGFMAAVELAEQFYYAFTNPGACRLPTGVTKLTRQGLTIERLLPMFAKDQRTGLVLTDAFLAAYNPAGLRRRPTIRSPGYPRFPRRTPQP